MMWFTYVVSCAHVMQSCYASSPCNVQCQCNVSMQTAHAKTNCNDELFCIVESKKFSKKFFLQN